MNELSIFIQIYVPQKDHLRLRRILFKILNRERERFYSMFLRHMLKVRRILLVFFTRTIRSSGIRPGEVKTSSLPRGGGGGGGGGRGGAGGTYILRVLLLGRSSRKEHCSVSIAAIADGQSLLLTYTLVRAR